MFEFSMVKKIIVPLSTILALMACQVQPNKTVIKAGGPAGGRDKPINESPLLGLSASIFGVAYETIQAATGGTRNCLVKTGDALVWSCDTGKGIAVGRRGPMPLSRKDTVWTVGSPFSHEYPLVDRALVSGGQSRLGNRHIYMTLNDNGALVLNSHLAFTGQNSSRRFSVLVEWSLKGRIAKSDLTSSEIKFVDFELFTDVQIFDQSGMRISESKSTIKSSDLKLQDCGHAQGSWIRTTLESGSEAAFEATYKDGIYPQAGGPKLAWPSCDTSAADLKLALPFWLRPGI